MNYTEIASLRAADVSPWVCDIKVKAYAIAKELSRSVRSYTQIKYAVGRNPCSAVDPLIVVKVLKESGRDIRSSRRDAGLWKTFLTKELDLHS